MARVVGGSGTAAPVAVGAGIVSGLPNGMAVTPTLHGPAPTALVASTAERVAGSVGQPGERWWTSPSAEVLTADPPGGAGLISTV